MSIGERLAATMGRPSGFDYLRLGLALAVALLHCRSTYFGVLPYPHLGVGDLAFPWMGISRPISVFFMPMFFALSGFLVAASLQRSKTLLTFLGLRAIRIYPGLAVVVVFSAFLVGTLATKLPLASYFRDPMLWTYLLTVTGDIHNSLPGVFVSNPLPQSTNAQLWTVGLELFCYVTLAGLALAGIAQRRILVLVGVTGLALAQLVMHLEETHWQFPIVLSPGGIFPGFLLFLCFLAGVSFYLYRDKIPWSPFIFICALVAACAFLWLVPLGEYPAIIALTYVTVFLGLTNFNRLAMVRGSDYSYGIYIYHFVIIQLFIQLAAPRSWVTVALVCLPLTALLATFSWHIVEKPAQKLRHYLPAAERRYLALKGRLAGRLRYKAQGAER